MCAATGWCVRILKISVASRLCVRISEVYVASQARLRHCTCFKCDIAIVCRYLQVLVVLQLCVCVCVSLKFRVIS